MRRPVWDYPEIDEWDDDPSRDDRQLIIGAGFGFGFGCYPRRFCFPRQGFFFGCYPRQFGCFPRRPCFPV